MPTQTIAIAVETHAAKSVLTVGYVYYYLIFREIREKALPAIFDTSLNGSFLFVF